MSAPGVLTFVPSLFSVACASDKRCSQCSHCFARARFEQRTSSSKTLHTTENSRNTGNRHKEPMGCGVPSLIRYLRTLGTARNPGSYMRLHMCRQHRYAIGCNETTPARAARDTSPPPSLDTPGTALEPLRFGAARRTPEVHISDIETAEIVPGPDSFWISSAYSITTCSSFHEPPFAD